MRFTPVFLAAAAAQGAMAAPRRPGDAVTTKGKVFSCGAPEPSPEHIKISQAFATQELQALASGNYSIKAVTTIDAYFHVVAKDTSISGGYLTVCNHSHSHSQRRGFG